MSVSHGANVALTASPAAGSQLAQWGGACSGTGQCSVTVNAATFVSAQFALQPTWTGDFETADISQYAKLQACGPGNALVYSTQSQPTLPAPRQGNYAVAFMVNDNDVAGEPLCPYNGTENMSPTDNPRAQLLSQTPGFFDDGDEFWIGHSVFLPSGLLAAVMPDQITPGWLALFSIYGDGFPDPAVDSCVHTGLDINVERDGDPSSPTFGQWVNYFMYKYDDTDRNGIAVPHWKAKATTGAWHDFVWHVRFSTDPGVGFVELWHNGQQQTFATCGGSAPCEALWQCSPDGKRLMKRTWPTGLQRLHAKIMQYRRRGMWQGTQTLFADGLRVGLTYDSVAPNR